MIKSAWKWEDRETKDRKWEHCITKQALRERLKTSKLKGIWKSKQMGNESQVVFFPNIFILNSPSSLSSKVKQRKWYFSLLSFKVGTGQYPSRELAYSSVQNAVTIFPLLENCELCKQPKHFYDGLFRLHADHQQAKRRCLCLGSQINPISVHWSKSLF